MLQLRYFEVLKRINWKHELRILGELFIICMAVLFAFVAVVYAIAYMM